MCGVWRHVHEDHEAGFKLPGRSLKMNHSLSWIAKDFSLIHCIIFLPTPLNFL